MTAPGPQCPSHPSAAAVPHGRRVPSALPVAATADQLDAAVGRSRAGGPSVDPISDGIARCEIEASLAAVLASETFGHSQRHRDFLAYVVTAVLDGRIRSLKEVVIGLEVFARQLNGYDPDRDSIVRVEARRLRAKLQRYYADEGLADRVRIGLPIGSYVPVFRRRTPVPGPPAAPLFLVLPFLSMDDDARGSALATTLADLLMDRLAAQPDARVMAPIADCGLRARRLAIEALRDTHGIDYIVDGSITRRGSRFRCVAHLSRTADATRAWSGLFEHDTASPEHEDLFAFQDRLVDETCAAVAGERSSASH